MIRNYKSSGFTLIELMVAVSVVGVLVAIAMPSFNYTIQNNRVKTSASDAHISLLLARSEAIKRNDSVTVTFSNTGWLVSYYDTDSSSTKILSQKNDLSSDVDYDCTLDGSAASLPQSVVFNRSGRPDHLLELEFTSSVNSEIPLRCVSLSLSGRPKVETDSDSDASNGCN